MHYDPLSLDTPSQQFQHGNASQHLETLEDPYFGQPQTIFPFPALNITSDDPQQSTCFQKKSSVLRKWPPVFYTRPDRQSSVPPQFCVPSPSVGRKFNHFRTALGTE